MKTKGLRSTRGLGFLYVLENLYVVTVIGGDMKFPQLLLLVRWRVILLIGKEKCSEVVWDMKGNGRKEVKNIF